MIFLENTGSLGGAISLEVLEAGGGDIQDGKEEGRGGGKDQIAAVYRDLRGLVLKCRFWATREKNVDSSRINSPGRMISRTEKKQKVNKRYYRRGTK